MKVHISRSPDTGRPTVLAWGLSGGDRGILDGMAHTFGMRIVSVAPADAQRTVAQLLGEPDAASAAPAPAVSAPAAAAPDAPAAILLANFSSRELSRLLELLHQAGAAIPLKAVVTPTNRGWTFAALLAHLCEERAAFAKAQGAH